MYIQKPLAENNVNVLHDFIRDNSFGTLILASDKGTEANHIPFELIETGNGQGVLRGHVALQNTLLEMVEDVHEVLVVFTGENCYISPALHPASKTHGKVAPSWNYSAVHAYGNIKIERNSSWLINHLSSLTEQYESKRETPWSISDTPDGFVETTSKYVVGIEITITKLQGKFQASQQYKEPVRKAIAHGLLEENDPSSNAVSQMISSRSSIHQE
jgi:transcriptional regulator